MVHTRDANTYPRGNPGTPTPAEKSHRRSLGPNGPIHRARGSAATDNPSASATSCAKESCTATEIRCTTNVIQVRADHVVSLCSEEARAAAASIELTAPRTMAQRAGAWPKRSNALSSDLLRVAAWVAVGLCLLTIYLLTTFGAPVRRVFPDHLITYLKTLVKLAKTARARCRWSALSAVACEVM